MEDYTEIYNCHRSKCNSWRGCSSIWNEKLVGEMIIIVTGECYRLSVSWKYEWYYEPDDFYLNSNEIC